MFYSVLHTDGAIAGIVSYLRITPPAYSIEIGHIWHAAARQRGRANTEAVFLLAENAFALGYRRVEWKCDACNIRSRLAALRLGFAFEGVFRQCTISQGKNRDTAWFAVIDRDWPPIRDNFRRWLAAKDGAFSLAEAQPPAGCLVFIGARFLAGINATAFRLYNLFPHGNGCRNNRLPD